MSDIDIIAENFPWLLPAFVVETDPDCVLDSPFN
jgi:hypothetical protein